MQYKVLVVVLCAIIIILFSKNILSHFNKKKLAAQRKTANVYDIYNEQFSGIDKKEFIDIWEGLAKAINMESGKLYPDDRLADIARLYPFSELLYEDLEDYIKQTGVENIENNINKQSTIRDIIFLIYQSRRKS